MNKYFKYFWLSLVLFLSVLLPGQGQADQVANSVCSSNSATLLSLQQVANFGYSSVCWYFCPGICMGAVCYVPQSSSFSSCTDLCQTISGVVSTGGGSYCGPGYAVTCINPTNCQEVPGSSPGWCKQVCDCSGSIVQGTNSNPSGYCDGSSQCNCQLNSLGGLCQMNYSGSFSATLGQEYICGGAGGGGGGGGGGSGTPPIVDLKVNSQDATSGSPLAVPRKDSSSITLSWTVSGATSCTASKSASAPGTWGGSKSTSSGSEVQSPINVAGNHSYTLTCSNAGGQTAADTVYITVPTCNNLSFVSGSVTPATVSASGSYKTYCNYGVSTNSVFPSVGSGSCSWDGSAGPNYGFNCTAGTVSGTFSNSCTLATIAPDYYCASTNSINSLIVTSSTGSVQGFKVKMPGNLTNDATINGQTVTVDGANAKTSNPYIYNNVSAGSHTVAVTVPAGYTAGYTLCYNNTTCHSNAPTAGSSVTVNVPASGYADLWWHFTPIATPPPPPTGGGSYPLPTADNSQCGKIVINWADGTGGGSITSYQVFRNTSNNFAAASNISGNLAATTHSYTDSTVTAATVYYYWVQATGPGGTSYSAITGNSVSAPACTANLDSSDKDVVALNGVNLYSSMPFGNICTGTDAIPSGKTFTLGDTVKFSINLCNTGSGSASSITITDSLINLKMPASGWNAQYCTGTCSAITPTVSGTSPNQTLTFTLPASIAAGGTPSLTFEATLAVPSGFSGAIARFQNSFNASYNNGVGVVNLFSAKFTPLYQFYTGTGVPTFKESP